MFRAFSAPEHVGIITQPSVLQAGRRAGRRAGRVPYCRLFIKGNSALDYVDRAREGQLSGRDGTIYGFN